MTTITRLVATVLASVALVASGATAAQAHHYGPNNPAPPTTDLATFCANIHNQHPACAGQPAPAPAPVEEPVTTVTLVEFCQPVANRHPACLELRDEDAPKVHKAKGKRHAHAHRHGKRHGHRHGARFELVRAGR